MPNKDLVRSERVSVRQRVVDLLAGGAVGRGASSRCAPGRLHNRVLHPARGEAAMTAMDDKFGNGRLESRN
jgi:hypothetical protein